ncbi:NHLP bacteriocin export ABC transporter permease/ATPase subunit [Roseofilum casamattae]|uniref:NHLP bacteriocin export ABC transporter permease/ATPase subunit n=1 Tax=Roseofilum casamattae BLCC-M143 TaxID=3022442 RepID=A0ABT7BYT2_9CYAN|nr:NHLP bacteriocin export ABC transporter permease/ATPase subunit [Roseofilum casamattae]MDJ1184359.1 NHLP bacteriocin export ABC transporter permease/ATPase subunit [Roseofilum casamattae BLCC-M143]
MNFPETTQTVIQGNKPLLLNDSNQIWVIESGAMVVFAVSVVNGVAEGARRYLFSTTANEALFGLSNLENIPYQLLAIAIEETTLTSCSLADVLQPGAENSYSSQKKHIEQWSDRLTSCLANTNIAFTAPAPIDFNSTTELSAYLEKLHHDFLHSIDRLEQEELASKLAQFEERQRLNNKSQRSSIGDLVSVLKPKQAEFLQEGTPLLVAAGAVGRAMGIEIRPGARSDDAERMKNPLEGIARASGIRTRRAILSDRWWQKDCGPLLAYTEEEKHPVALLPGKRGGYEVFDPVAETRTPVTRRIATQLHPLAYTFYRPFPEQALNFWELLKFSLRGLGLDVITILLMGVLAALVGMVVPQATGILMDRAIPDANRNLLLQIGLALFAASFGKAIFELAQGFAILRVEALFNFANQAALWDRLLKLRMSFFRQYSSGDLLDRTTTFDQMREVLNANVLRSLFTGLFSLLNLGLMLSYSVPLALAAGVIAIANFTVTIIVGNITRKKIEPLQEIQGEIFGLTVQLIGGVSKLRIAGAEKRGFAYWTKKYREQLMLTLSTEGVEDAVNLFNVLLPTISSVIIFAIAAQLIATAQAQGQPGLSTGQFLAFNAAFGILIAGITDLSDTLIEILEVFVLWERAKPILTATPEVDLSKADPGKLKGHVKLDRVTFRYREDGPLILNEVTIEAKAGEFIAFVGPSGSGKSTTIRLLLGFETPEDGTIYYDGQDLSGLDISAIRRQLGVVLQNGRINSDSIFENISSGALVTMDEVWEAAQMAGFAEDIEKMPMGMHTVISEGGGNLSGGQRQRLLIARSLVLKPKILIFDEATSALDNRTQAIVSKSLDNLNVTRIVIAHRLSTIVNADRIYVIESGIVVQQGTFDELAAQPGLFAQLMARQTA